jgi:hypothetical protein
MHDPASELRRTPVPRTWVNKRGYFGYRGARGRELDNGLSEGYPNREASDSVASLPARKGNILLCERSVCALWHKARQNTKEAPNFLEFTFHELR